MNPTQQLHALGQSLWLDNITRTMVADGTLAHYIRDLAVTGLTSNPTIFEQAIRSGSCYDKAIRGKFAHGKSGEALFFELALEDLVRAADPAQKRDAEFAAEVLAEFLQPVQEFIGSAEFGRIEREP